MSSYATESTSKSILVFPGQFMDISLCPLIPCSCLHCSAREPGQHCVALATPLTHQDIHSISEVH